MLNYTKSRGIEQVVAYQPPAEDAELTADDTKTEENAAAFEQQP